MTLSPLWKPSGPGKPSADYDPKTNISTLSYSLSGPEVHNVQTWRFTNKEISNTDVILDWDYSGFHAWYQAWIKIALELKKKDGTTHTKVLMEGPKRGNITGKGEEPASLKDCVEYSFVIQGKNFDSDTRLNGTLKVTETEDEDPKWRTEGPGDVSATYDAETDYSALSYKLTGDAVHNLQTWRYTSAEISANEVAFDWEYSGFHAWYRAWIKITLELKKEDGTVDTKVLLEGNKRGNITGKGQEHVSLTGCKEYAFVIQGKNFDSDTRLLGTLKVKEDPYDKGQITWETDGPGEVSANYNEQTDTSALSYKITGQEVHNLQTWHFTNKNIGDNDALFDWDYSGFHAWYRAYIKIALELKKADGTVDTYKLMEGERRGNITGKGQEVVVLKDYTEYAFVIQGRNFDRDTRLYGTLNVEVREV